MRGFFNKRASLLTRLAGMVVPQANEPKPEPVERSTSAPATFSEDYGQGGVAGNSELSEIGVGAMLTAPRVCRTPAYYLARVPMKGFDAKELYVLNLRRTSRRPRGCRKAKYDPLHLMAQCRWQEDVNGVRHFVRDRPINTEASASDETYAIKA